MQRYSAPNCSGGFSNTTVGGASTRDNSTYSSSNYSLNSRRQPQVIPYKLKCEKEPLNCRLGPPDFYPQVANCPEETLTREYLLSGYKETIEGIEESREIIISRIGFSKNDVLKCKEAIRKRLRAINESRAQKRKAGQVYGVPLSGQLLVKPGLFPEQRQLGEDYRRKWIEGLSQQHKRLRSLADHVPHGYRKKDLLEVVIQHNVPLLRASWFIKVTYLNQVRPNAAGISSGTLEKTQLTCTEVWTKDLVEYLQYLLEEFLAKDGFFPPRRGGDLSQTLLSGVSNQRNNLLPTIADSEEPSLQFRWEYVLRLLRWHYLEGLLSPSLILDWVLAKLQEKDSVDVMEFIMPIVVNLIESIAMSQTYVRLFVEMAIRFLRTIDEGCITDARRSYLDSTLVELLRYLLISVPDSFIALDCFPLPISVAPDTINGKSIFSVRPELADKVGHSSQDAYHSYLSFGHVASSLMKRATSLAKITNVDLHGQGVAKAVQALEKALLDGDLQGAYNCLFEELSDSAFEESWIAEINPSLRSSMKLFGTVSSSVLYSVFFLCEWATCDFRDYRNLMPQDARFSGKKDFCQIYVAVSLLKCWMKDMHDSSWSKRNNSLEPTNIVNNASVNNDSSVEASLGNVCEHTSSGKNFNEKNVSNILQSPGPLHDIIVCWLDQHCYGKQNSFKNIQILIMELVRHGMFYPQAYVRQLIVSGVMDRNGTSVDIDGQRKHYKILKQLPASSLFDTLVESQIADTQLIHEAVQVYSNERDLVLHGFHSWHSPHKRNIQGNSLSFDSERIREQLVMLSDGSSSLLDNHKSSMMGFNELTNRQVKLKSLAQLKVAISALLHFPDSCCSSVETELNESQASSKRSIGSLGTRVDVADGRSDCEQCTMTKKQRLSNERLIQGFSSNQSDDEDTWWVRRGTKSLESFKAEEPLRPAKHVSRGRRKTQSLAQLAAGRIEGSQGASTSNVCDSKLSCPHHKTATDSEILRDVNRIRRMHLIDIGRALKALRWLEKRSIVIWLLNSVKLLIEENENISSKLSQCGPFSPPTDEGCVVRWKLGEDELSSILYLLDISSDLYSLVKFLLWLLPKFPKWLSDAHLGRNAAVLSRNKENHIYGIGEAYLLSALQRYENVLAAANLLPEALNALMHRAMILVASNGRASSSLAFVYARNLLKKYGKTSCVAKWEKSFKATCDPRILQEIDTRRSVDGDIGYPFGIPAGASDPDDYIRQKISGRMPRAGQIMKEIVQRNVEEAVGHFYGKEMKFFSVAANMKIPTLEKWDDACQIAQKIVQSLLDCVRQNGGTSQEADPSLVAAAVSAIVSNVGPAIVKLLDFMSTGNYQSSSAASSLSCIQGILNIHVACLCLLKEAIGERLCRVMEIALASEASSNISGAYASVRVPRGQFHPSPEALDLNPNNPSDISNNKNFFGRASKIAAAVSALVVRIIIHGVSSLQRMITVFKLNEGLRFRNVRFSSNGISRSSGNYKSDHYIEVNVHWFRLLIGNCSTLFDGLVSDILGESSTLALSRMQRMLPLNLAFPPAYSIFAMVIWWPYIINSNIATNEDVQLYQSLLVAIGDAIKHQPLRDLCLRDTCGLSDLMSSELSQCDCGPMEAHSPDKHMKVTAFVPLRSRLFLDALVDCSMPSFTTMKDDGSCVWVSGHVENETKVLDQLVHILDTLHPAKFHWQWLELKLLLNEQALIEKVETQNMSVVEALRSLSTCAENDALSENESAFTDIVLTRLLVRPDAAALYSEVFRLLGRSLEEKLLLQTKWFLAGNDVLLGRKSIRQRLVNVAQDRGLSTKSQFQKLWGWSTSMIGTKVNKFERRKLEVTALEEGEVIEEGTDNMRSGKLTYQIFSGASFGASQQYATDKALAELVLPCIDRSSNEARATFATDLIKQMNKIYQHIILLTCGSNKQSAGGLPSIGDGSNKGSTRKGIRGGSPGIGRRTAGTKDSSPPSAAALKASIWLRLQFLLRLFPVILSDRDPSSRNMRHTLATVLLHLLGTQLVYEDAEPSPMRVQSTLKKEHELAAEASICHSDVSGEGLFEMMLSVLHGLLGGCKPSWLKTSLTSKLNTKSSRDLLAFGRDLIESLQTDLDGMQLPARIRRRLQASMPVLPHTPTLVSCHPPLMPSASRPAILTGALQQPNPNSPHRIASSSARSMTNLSIRSKSLPLPDTEMEVDPWTLLEDGTGSASVSSNINGSGGVSNVHSNLKASSWLRGAVRVRRTDLTYIGAMDDGS